MVTPKDTEALIIGAGLSGAVIATVLARAGVKVTCLEQGGRCNAEDYRGRYEDWELAGLGPWHGSPNVRGAAADYPIDDSNSEMKPMMFNGVGGSTILYGAHWMRFLPSDFRVRTLDGVGDDWPISYAELAPWYDEADRQFGASGLAGDPAYPDRPDYPLPPLPVGRGGEKIAAAHVQLGWHWWPGSNAIASRPYDGRRQCVQRSTCGTGCNEGAKASVDITHWPKALSSWGAAGHRSAGAQDLRRQLRPREWRRLPGQQWCPAQDRQRRRDRRGQCNRQRASAACVTICAVSPRSRQPIGPGREASHAPSLYAGSRLLR